MQDDHKLYSFQGFDLFVEAIEDEGFSKAGYDLRDSATGALISRPSFSSYRLPSSWTFQMWVLLGCPLHIDGASYLTDAIISSAFQAVSTSPCLSANLAGGSP
jgi:hypothetical protein